MPIVKKMVVAALFLGVFACQSKHDVNVEPVEIKPIHITIDVNVRIEKALDDFLKVCSLNPNNDTAFLNTGITYEKMRQNTKAIEYYQLYLKLQPGNMTVRKWVMDLRNQG